MVMPKVLEYTPLFTVKFEEQRCSFTGQPLKKLMRLYVLDDGRKLPVGEDAHDALNPQRRDGQDHLTLQARIEEPTALTVLLFLRGGEGRSVRLYWRNGTSMKCSLSMGKVFTDRAEKGMTVKAWEARLNDPARGGLWAWSKQGG
jgi:hypothetical protein